jgi:zinc transport system substrate-binding protein
MRQYLIPLFFLAAPASAEPPRVVTDIAPVHSLAAQVMGDVGVPSLTVPSEASPHGYRMRPSEARALSEAEIVFWIGPELSPAFAGSVESLASAARSVPLIDEPDTIVYDLRERVIFSEDDTQDDHDDHDDHAAHDGHGHAHDGLDPHAWLDPRNAAVWLETMAVALAEADPENATTYRANAAAALAKLGTLEAELAEQLDAAEGKSFLVFHDAYQYFETRFSVDVLGAINVSDATPSSPARLAALRDALEANPVSCIFAEPQFNPGLVTALSDGTGLASAVLDPLGASIEPGPDFYDALLRDMAKGIVTC